MENTVGWSSKVSTISFGSPVEGIKPFVKIPIHDLPLLISGTSTIPATVFARNKEGLAKIIKSLPLATSLISVEAVRFLGKVKSGKNLFECLLLISSTTSCSKAHI